MKLFLLKSFVFLSIVFAGTKLLGYWDHVDADHSENSDILKIKYADLFDSLDLLVVGNSYGYSSIATPVLNNVGIKSYILGLPTAGVEFYEELTTSYLNQIHKQPKTIAFIVSPMTFSQHADNWTDYPIHRYFDSPITNEGIVLKYGHPEDYLPLLFNSCRKGLLNLFTPKRAKSPDLTKFYQSRGFYIDSSITNTQVENNTKHLYLPMLSDHFDHSREVRLTQLTERLSDRKIRVIFIETPTHHLHQFLNKQFMDEYAQMITRLKSNYQVIDAPEMKSTYFRNIDHMNTQGAYAYTNFILTQLHLN